ncbi:MAG TPA: dihydrodipicolinate synthase family protein [Bacteroidales bacterium]|nr:dihydrodipicolinate synthase family protein [Bacteroidales bacterium]HPT22773.1 dihydrodipicolinate synthase family protein [Bacteroidales bacterium]
MNRQIPADIITAFNNGVVIPALPLALNSKRQLDERRQRALFRYYLDSGAGGIAVAVHTTQFAIRQPEIGLFSPLLSIANEEFNRFSLKTKRPVIRISGVIGRTEQAVKEARLACDNGFHAVLLSLAALPDDSNEDLIKHCRCVAEIMPVIGFYLQPAVGGRKLDISFWREFAKIENVIGIKMAPFNRYQTLDVVRGVIESGRSEEIALYTGNDDNILVDLLSEYRISDGKTIVSKRIVGGLLGHWAVWTHNAVKLLESVHNGNFYHDVQRTLALANKITDCNAAFFDVANNFKGCIVGLHEILRRQGLLEGVWTLNESESLSQEQLREIDRVCSAYPELNDNAFIAKNLDKWLS